MSTPAAVQHGEVLREVRGFESGGSQHFGDGGFVGRGQDFEHPNAVRMREPLEEVRLDSEERPALIENGHGAPISA